MQPPVEHSKPSTSHPHKSLIRRGVMWALIGASGLAASSLLAPTSREAEAAPTREVSAPIAPEIMGKSWLNKAGKKPISLGARRGQVTIVQFWALGCLPCRANLPAYERLRKKFAGRGVEVVGVHTPMSPFERDPKNVARAVKDLSISYPVLLDARGENWGRWGQKYWPTLHVIDKAGRARFKWEGELDFKGAGGEKKVEAVVERLLGEVAPPQAQAAGSVATASLLSNRVEKSDAEWRAVLTSAQYDVLRHEGTERPGSGELLHVKDEGTWKCAGCGQPLFSSSTKFESGTGWPSFWKPIEAGAVHENTDTALGMSRTEVECARCGGHLGHVFDDGPAPTGLRYCMNSVAMTFEKK